jgi:uncharacterized membrane-anchored protein YhcB (DUF1043 family)
MIIAWYMIIPGLILGFIIGEVLIRVQIWRRRRRSSSTPS